VGGVNPTRNSRWGDAPDNHKVYIGHREDLAFMQGTVQEKRIERASADSDGHTSRYFHVSPTDGSTPNVDNKMGKNLFAGHEIAFVPVGEQRKVIAYHNFTTQYQMRSGRGNRRAAFAVGAAAACGLGYALSTPQNLKAILSLRAPSSA